MQKAKFIQVKMIHWKRDIYVLHSLFWRHSVQNKFLTWKNEQWWVFLCKFRHLETFCHHVRSMWNLGVNPWSKSYCLGVTWQDESSKLFCILSLGMLILLYQNWLFQMCITVFVSATITFFVNLYISLQTRQILCSLQRNIEQSGQDLHSLFAFSLHLLDFILKPHCWNFRTITPFIHTCQLFENFMGEKPWKWPLSTVFLF